MKRTVCVRHGRLLEDNHDVYPSVGGGLKIETDSRDETGVGE